MNTPHDELIENALRTYPLADVPVNFSQRIMRQIQPRHAALKFRLTWMDYALGLFLCLLPGVGFVTWAFLPRQLFINFEHQRLLLISPVYWPIVLVTLASLAGLALLVFIFVGLRYLIRPQYSLL